MTRLNHYIVAALPELGWDSELPGTVSEFLEEFKVQLEPLKDGINDILLLNDIKNLELILKSKLDIPEKFLGNRDKGEVDFYKAKVLELDELKLFFEDPFVNRPYDSYPDFIEDYLIKYKPHKDSHANIEELYIDYFRYMQTRENYSLRYYGKIAITIRTVMAAKRIMGRELDLETHLQGDPFIVSTILENKNSSDLGLRHIFPEVSEVVAIFDRAGDPLKAERDLDRIRFELMEQLGRESPFADHTIYSYIIRFQIRNRWNTLDSQKGIEILDNIIKGNY